MNTLFNTHSAFFGLDVHKKTISIAVAPVNGKIKYLTTIENDPEKIDAFFRPMLAKYDLVFTIYEAGACGYVLDKQLKSLKIHSIVLAPSSVKRPHKTIKNDKKDAEYLANLLRGHHLVDQELSPVYVLDRKTESVRELIRLRDFTKNQAKKIQNAMTSMLQRHGVHYTLTKTYWTRTFRNWLETVKFPCPVLTATFKSYIEMFQKMEAQLQDLEKDISVTCDQWKEKAFLIKCFQTFRGFGLLNSAKLVAEIGNFSRFETPRKLMNFVGLAPSEHSSGEKITRGRISKKGNKRVRTLLVEASCAAMKPTKSMVFLRSNFPPEIPHEVIRRAFGCQKRLYKKFWRLVNAGKNSNLARIAVAREFLGFLWDVAVKVESGAIKPIAKSA